MCVFSPLGDEGDVGGGGGGGASGVRFDCWLPPLSVFTFINTSK